jgi:uncharacterized protein YbjT (DUF2867 family)
VSTLLVLGGSGRTGIHVLEHAIARGHQVRALVRNPDAFEAPAGVQLITGTRPTSTTSAEPLKAPRP